MPKLTLRQHHVRHAITTLSREQQALAAQAHAERKSGDHDAAVVFESRAQALDAIRNQLTTARHSRSTTLDLDHELFPHIRDVALFGCDGWRFAS